MNLYIVSFTSTSIDSKIFWIKQDGIKVSIANQLVELGVPKEDIRPLAKLFYGMICSFYL
ncbi:element excision factor XisI family protein [Nostoc sp. WHI]|uniref:element excision factor XisI family protein n=1 Tax=Nostoc sp. WHI TaxID=2650611 RepID=UPI0018C477D1|nr:element excision factor XisI family protein [Nostoc sp. WHI]MBG1266985.1 hypothetical protein [Nostoc sp. WHI]